MSNVAIDGEKSSQVSMKLPTHMESMGPDILEGQPETEIRRVSGLKLEGSDP
jgi:hypothetical protein